MSKRRWEQVQAKRSQAINGIGQATVNNMTVLTYDMDGGDYVYITIEPIKHVMEIVDERIDFERLENHESIKVWHVINNTLPVLKQEVIMDVSKGVQVMINELSKKWIDKLYPEPLN
jgi:hypothetical protein